MERTNLNHTDSNLAGDTQFRCEVFPAELEEIKKRRENLFGEAPDWPTARPPSTALGLVGLAFSGGGIRSATYNLGVVQMLAQNGLLKYVDYLSTVSGGGYTGSCLSSLLNNPQAGPEGDAFPFRHQPSIEEPDAFRYLRNNSNYLAPGGSLDALRIPALLLRGILINLLLFLPFILLAVFLTDLVYGGILRSGQVDSWTRFYQITPWTLALFLVWIVLFPPSQWLMRKRLVTKYKSRNLYELSFAMGFLSILAAALLESLPAALFYYNKWLETDSRAWWTWGTTLVSLIPYLFAHKASGNVAKTGGKIALYALGILGPFVLLLIYLGLGNWIIIEHASGIKPYIIYGGTIPLFFYMLFFVDVNVTSLHNFYRDRLSKAYLFQFDAEGNIQPNDKQKLSTLNAAGTKGPYHLINATLNLQGSDDPNLRGRGADFFIFSKHFVGSVRTGFCPTTTLENIDPHLDLGTAMAISGAAAAPNMGTATIRSLVFIMTLLNVRLGYWLPNPAILSKPWQKRGPFFGVGPFYLLKELFSRITASSRYVNVSDGGHIENLGVYELLRRRCKYIIACDGEADPDLTFSGLAKLIRYARINMGIDIDINLNDVRMQEAGLSRKQCAMGRIDYGQGEIGQLLYIKAALVGDENVYIRQYHATHPQFPHESTADQFFDEAQFETYRALGYHIVKELMQLLAGEQRSRAMAGELDMATCFATLVEPLRPQV